jgi:hypothetical protein
LSSYRHYYFKSLEDLTESEPLKLTSEINPERAITPSITKTENKESTKKSEEKHTEYLQKKNKMKKDKASNRIRVNKRLLDLNKNNVTSKKKEKMNIFFIVNEKDP